MLSRIIDGLVATVAPRMGVRRAFARQVLAQMGGQRGYAAARHGGHVWDRFRNSGNGSANVELAADLPTLRQRSRTLYQDTASAHAAVEALVALLVGTGIDLEPDTGDKRADERLRDEWRDWAEYASACGGMSLWDLQRQAIRCWALNGEALFQVVHLPPDGDRPIPFALHPIESDQLSLVPVVPVASGNRFAAGVEVDAYRRPVAYHVLDEHPGDGLIAGYQVGVNGSTLKPGNQVVGEGVSTSGRSGRGRRLPASDILHVYERLRPGQTRGVPLLAPIMGTLHQESQLVEAELSSAKIGAALSVFIAMEGGLGGQFAGQGDTGTVPGQTPSQPPTRTFEPGTIIEGAPGESAHVIKSDRPSQAIDPFRRMLRGDIAASLGIRQTDLDRDYSRANYSSLRAALLDLARTVKPLQDMFGAQLVGRAYRKALPQLATTADIILPRDRRQLRKVQRYTLLPDGFAYVDPEKDVKGAILAIRSGLSCWRDELALRGKDASRLHARLEQELEDPLLAKIMVAEAQAAAAQPSRAANQAAPAEAEAADAT